MATPPVTNGRNGVNPTPTGQLSGVPLVFAFSALALWLAAMIYLHFYEIAVDDRTWQRAIFLFHSVEAVAFAAAGAVLGREVHRANEAEKRATKAEGDADVGKQVAQAVKTEASMLSRDPSKRALWADGESESLRLARKLLPD